jgi:cell division initiation protein
MRITPLDIRKQPFRKKLMGFDPDEVNSFLEMVASEFEAINRRHDELLTQLKQCQTQLEQYTRIEKTLNETLITAQRATDEARLNAQKESELILKDAQIRADRYEEESRRRVHELEADLMTLKTQRESFLTRFKSMLRDQLALLDVINDSLGSENADQMTDTGHGEEPGGEILGEVSDDAVAGASGQPDLSRIESALRHTVDRRRGQR